MVIAEDTTGLICGFVIQSDCSISPVKWEVMDAVLSAPEGTVWLHLNLADVRAQHWIRDSAYIPRPAKEILLSSDTHMRLEPVGHGLVGVLGDLHHEFSTESATVATVRLYLDNHCLITARREPLRATDRLRRAIEADAIRVNGAHDLLIQLLDHLSSAIGGVLAELGTAIDDVEDRILADETTNDAGDLGRVRRAVAQIRRHIVPQRQALAGFLNHLPPWMNEQQTAALRMATERLAAVGHDLDYLQERAHLLQGELSGRLAETTNRNLYNLSIMTAIFLPMTLITGVFGMNVASVPGVGDDQGGAFWWVMAGMLGSGGLTLLGLHLKRIF